MKCLSGGHAYFIVFFLENIYAKLIANIFCKLEMVVYDEWLILN